MLVSSKNKNEKVVLGLLSYTYGNQNLTIEEQQQIIIDYRDDDQYELYLYEDTSTENFVGILAVELIKSNKDENVIETVSIHKVAVVPSFRGEGIGLEMYKELKKKHPNASIIGTMDTVDLVTKWSKEYSKMEEQVD